MTVLLSSRLERQILHALVLLVNMIRRRSRHDQIRIVFFFNIFGDLDFFHRISSVVLSFWSFIPCGVVKLPNCGESRKGRRGKPIGVARLCRTLILVCGLVRRVITD